MRILAIAAALCAATVAASAQDLPKPVKLMEVEARTGGTERQFFGQVVARETVDLAFQVSGQIVEFPAVEGEPIPKGALVAKLDIEPFQLALDEATVRLDQAARDLDRFERLSSNAVSQATIDEARTAFASAEIAVRTAEYNLDQATMHAPFDALVAARNVANFTTTSAGAPVVRLHDMSELRIDIDVPEILFQRAGADPDIEVSAQFPVSDERYPLEVREFNAEATGVGQTFRITFALPRHEGLNIFPGSSVTVFTRLNSGPPEILVPPTALLPGEGGGLSVMVFAPSGADEGTVERRPVTAEIVSDGKFRVADGLTGGEEIVVAGVAALEDGQTVRRFGGFPE